MQQELGFFNEYYSKFDNSIDQINYKYDHTFRVINYAKKIAKSLDLNEEDFNKVCVCALFHDIGRFEQFTKYKTFEDLNSVDHGDLGEKILKEEGYTDNEILLAVKYHNKYSVPEDLTEREKLFTNIIRDADKLDILFAQGFKNKDEEYIYYDYVIKSIRKGEIIDSKKIVNERKSDVLKLLRLIAFVYDFNFKKSLDIIKEGNIINKKFDLILDKFDKKEIKDLKVIVNNYLNKC